MLILILLASIISVCVEAQNAVVGENSQMTAVSLDTGKLNCWQCNIDRDSGEVCSDTYNYTKGFVPNYKMNKTRCAVCMKITTLMRVRDRLKVGIPMTTQQWKIQSIVSRACIKRERDARLLNGCIEQTAQDGTIKRCYCNSGHHCNGAVTTATSPAAMTFALTLAAIYSLKVLQL